MSAHQADRQLDVYDEDDFRHFLAIERRRAERSGRSLLLLLVDIRPDEEGHSAIDPASADALFGQLAICVREIEVIGWYRTGRSAGAVLTQGSSGPPPDISRQIGERVARVLSQRLPARLRARLEVRVLQLRASEKSRYA